MSRRKANPIQSIRTRFNESNPAVLSEIDLLALLIEQGPRGSTAVDVAHALCKEFSGFDGIAWATVTELMRVAGIGEAKATQIHAAMEIGRRLVGAKPIVGTRVKSPTDVGRYLMARIGKLEQEEVWVVSLNNQNVILSTTMLYRGCVNSVSMRFAEVFREPIRRNATAIIVAHNHPSGSLVAGAEDVRAAKDLYAAGKMLGIELLDNLIIGSDSFISLKERDLIPRPEVPWPPQIA